MRNRCDVLRAQPEYNDLLEPCLFELSKLLEYVGGSSIFLCFLPNETRISFTLCFVFRPLYSPQQQWVVKGREWKGMGMRTPKIGEKRESDEE